VVLASLSLVLALGGETLVLRLRLEASGIRDGEWWRLLTAHLVHAGWVHLLMNLAGLLVIWVLVGKRLSAGTWAFVILSVALVCSASLLLLNPQLGWYVGLSGLLHGLLATGALAGLRDHPIESSLLLAILVIKLVVEQAGLAPIASQALIGQPVIVDAHVYGAIAGVLCYPAAMRLEGRLTQNPSR
jgi:rhomboid family GlyGly-CTERM serine protease